jgi:hypothetical protein
MKGLVIKGIPLLWAEQGHGWGSSTSNKTNEQREHKDISMRNMVNQSSEANEDAATTAVEGWENKKDTRRLGNF